MLHKETVAPATLGLLNQLMTIDALEGFALVGGTNLSLQLGHRLSIDLDLFTNQPFDTSKVKSAIEKNFSHIVKIDESRQSLLYLINDVKVDFILYEYPYIQEVALIDNIKFLSIKDIIPMKLGAIAGRGAKKDFWDIAELLTYYPLNEMLAFYRKKFITDDIGFILRSLLYFDDAENQTNPIALNNTTWGQVKEKIEAAVKNFTHNEIQN